ncbi:MAG: alpha/beta hydrolase [Mangrovicoccus sp.]|nr:alpha/beta hydrolase [Mangrovicoccus sp.]
MLFITNRMPKGSQFRPMSRRARHFQFDLRINAAANALFFCEAGPDGQHLEIGSQAMFARLRASDYRQVLLYLHGFNTSPATALRRAAQLQRLCDAAGPGEALVVPMIWPTDDDPGVLRDYFDDQRSADASGFAFARAFGKFMSWRDQDAACLKRINLLAHSMGGRVLREAMARWNKDDLPNGVPMLFRNIFLVASDLVNETFEPGQPGLLMCHAARNLVVYHAAEDLALRASKLANLRNGIASRRLGHTGPERMEKVLPNVISVDCDAVAMQYDRDKGHSYFLDDRAGNPGQVFAHIFAALQSGRVPHSQDHPWRRYEIGHFA